jgi:hypothetical protein
LRLANTAIERPLASLSPVGDCQGQHAALIDMPDFNNVNGVSKLRIAPF